MRRIHHQGRLHVSFSLGFASSTAYLPDHKQENSHGNEDEHHSPSASHEPLGCVLVHVVSGFSCFNENTSSSHSAEDPRIPAADDIQCDCRLRVRCLDISKPLHKPVLTHNNNGPTHGKPFLPHREIFISLNGYQPSSDRPLIPSCRTGSFSSSPTTAIDKA